MLEGGGKEKPRCRIALKSGANMQDISELPNAVSHAKFHACSLYLFKRSESFCADVSFGRTRRSAQPLSSQPCEATSAVSVIEMALVLALTATWTFWLFFHILLQFRRV